MLLFWGFLDIFSKFRKKTTGKVPQSPGILVLYEKNHQHHKPLIRRSACQNRAAEGQLAIFSITWAHDKLFVFGMHPVSQMMPSLGRLTTWTFVWHCPYYIVYVEHLPVAGNLFCANVCWVLVYFPTCQVRVVRFYVRLFSSSFSFSSFFSFFSFSSFVVVLLSFVVLLN